MITIITKNIKLIYLILILYIINRDSNKSGREIRLDCNDLSPNIDDPNKLECIRRLNLKPIQVLTRLFRSETWEYASLGRTPFEQCQGSSRCYAFKYTRGFQVPLENSDAILVHSHDLVFMTNRSRYRRSHRQIWSFFTHEPQRLSFCRYKGANITDFDDWFNLTHTIKSRTSYFAFDLNRLDSNPHYIISYMKTRVTSESSLIGKKKRLIMWFVSRCQSPNRREEFVRELSKYIPVDVYGSCGVFQDPCRNMTQPKSCLKDLYNSYKFYLSFENCNCDSYISEKYFKFYRPDSIFDVNIVPIVMGAKRFQYAERSPKSSNGHDSFIHPSDFDWDPSNLANYLSYLDRNQTAYMGYFQWKYELYSKLERNKWFLLYYLILETTKSYYKTPFCDLCEHLHDERYLRKPKDGVKISEYFNFVNDCDNSKEANESSTFYSLKNYCYYPPDENDDEPADLNKWKYNDSHNL